MESNTQDKKVNRQAGLDTIDQVYGAGFSSMLEAASGAPFVAETIDHLFADIWNRPGLSVRDRRLLVLGATAMLGKPELVEAQARGALLNNELTEAQLEEAVLQLAYYVGWGNATSTWQGVQAAKAVQKK
tara:strand:+ start:5313 stop:5702 length:390 start_codon:yes stop_codon:yes gene_type:complete